MNLNDAKARTAAALAHLTAVDAEWLAARETEGEAAAEARMGAALDRANSRYHNAREIEWRERRRDARKAA